MKQIDCNRCWFAKRKPASPYRQGESRLECAHPARAAGKVPVSRTLGPTGLVQLVACPKSL